MVTRMKMGCPDYARIKSLVNTTPTQCPIFVKHRAGRLPMSWTDQNGRTFIRKPSGKVTVPPVTECQSVKIVDFFVFTKSIGLFLLLLPPRKA